MSKAWDEAWRDDTRYARLQEQHAKLQQQLLSLTHLVKNLSERLRALEECRAGGLPYHTSG